MWTLTDKQLAMIKRAAALLPSHAQPALLRSVANVLAGVEHAPRDRDVMAVLRLILAERGISIGELLPRHERHYVHDRSANNWQSWLKRPQEAR